MDLNLKKAKAERNEAAAEYLLILIKILSANLDANDSNYEATKKCCDFWIDKLSSKDIKINWQ